jgi:ribosomal RNA assembly protein
MQKLICEKFPRITKNRRKLEEELDVKITNRGKEVVIEGSPENEYVAEKVIQALNFGFPFAQALSIKTDELEFEIIPIKTNTRQKNLERVRGRVIGTKGKTLKTLSTLTDCFLEIKDNEIGVIGDPEKLQAAQDAITSLLRGSKTSNVYSYLERHQPKKIWDLGLKDKNL